MNIVLINSGRRWIGEAAYTLSLYEQLQARGHKVILVARQGWELERRARTQGFPVVSLKMHSRIHLIDEPADMMKLRQLIKSEEIEIIHTHRGKDHWLAAQTLQTLRKKPALVRSRHVVTAVRRHIFNHWLYGHATKGLMAVSRAALESLGTYHLLPAPGKVRIIYPGVDTDCFHPEKRSGEVRAKLGVGEQEKLVGLIGRFQRVKGQGVFLEAAAEVSKRVPGVKFVLCGRDTKGQQKKLQYCARQLGIGDKVTVLDYQDEIAQLIASLDVGVIASLGSEGFSRVLLEYMASGVPVVATRVGAIPEILGHEKEGLLVPPGDVEGMSGALVQLLEADELREELGKEGRRGTERFYNLTRATEETLEFYGVVKNLG